ncbi:MAG: cupin domain-containing protein [Gammaproteobacteria bacterium]|nr:cupin domain-containing protein [Gammaproteobacteria bacterium]
MSGSPVRNGFISFLIACSLAVVAAAADAPPGRVILGDQPWYTADDGAIAREIASPRNSRLRSLSIADIRIPSGTVIEEHHHIGMEEVYWIAAGAGIMNIEGVSYEVWQGDAVVIRSHERHLITNPFAEELRLHVYCNPPWAPEALHFEPLPEDERAGPPLQPRVFSLAEQAWSGLDAGVQRRWMAAPENTPLAQLAVAEWLLDPQGVYQAKPGPLVEDVYFVLEGTLIVEVGDGSFTFKPLEAAVLAPGQTHRIRNGGSTALRLHHYANRPQ